MVLSTVSFSLALLWLGCHLYGYLFWSPRGIKELRTVKEISIIRPNPAFRAISPCVRPILCTLTVRKEASELERQHKHISSSTLSLPTLFQLSNEAHFYEKVFLIKHWTLSTGFWPIHAKTTKKTKQRRRRPYIKRHYFASPDTYLIETL